MLFEVNKCGGDMVNDNVIKWIESFVSTEMSEKEVADGLDGFQKYLELELSDLRYSDVINNMSQANDFEKKNYIKDFTDIEKFMKNLGDIIWDGKITKQMNTDASSGYSSTMLSNLYKQYFSVVPQNTWLNDDPDKHLNNHENHFIKVYQFRNSETHNHLTALNPKVITDITTSMMVCVLCLCATYKSEINEQYQFKKRNEELNITEYCRNIVREYTTNKDFHYLDVRWYEATSENGKQFTINDILETDDYINTKFLGEAGVGKTTALKRIEYNVAQNYLRNATRVIPVYIELKHAVDKDRIIEAEISKKLNLIGSDSLSAPFNYRGLCLLLDGYNEILNKSIQEKICNEINQISIKNKECRIFISDRGKARKNVNLLPDARRLYLYPMTIADKKRYFKDNIIDSKDAALMEEKLKQFPLYFDSLNSPLKLKNLADLLNRKHMIPDDLTASYLRMLFEREADKGDDNAGYLSYFLEQLAIDYEDKPMTSKEILSTFASVKKKFGFEDPDSLNCLKLLSDLGVLAQDEDEMYVFSNQDYYEYFLSEAVLG